MRDLYELLGIRSGAANAEIKAAFRKLAMRLHPDLRPGDEDAAQRFQDVVSAYETLSDAASREAYEAYVARHRSQMRRRFHAKVATMATVFTLTVCSVPVVVFWNELQDALASAREYSDRVPINEASSTIPVGAERAPARNAMQAEPSSTLATASGQPPADDAVTKPLPQSFLGPDLASSAYRLGSSSEPAVYLDSRIRWLR